MRANPYTEGGVRLQKVLAQAGVASRRASEQMIADGRVSVDGTVVRNQGVRVDPATQVIHVDGERLILDETKHIVLAVNKPIGTVSTMSDPEGRPTIADLIADYPERLYHVGRLDIDTSGLLLLTNDGELAHRLTSPRYHVEKEYLAAIDGTVDGQDAAAFAAGLTLGDGTRCLPAELEPLGPGRCLVTLREGKYHQVKRMLSACGKPVTALERVSMGPLQLDQELPRGGYRPLTPEEIQALRQAVRAEQSHQDSGQKVCGNY